ncbi:MAG: hypothetical protein RL017_318 [Pseudomonadota bacterium]|jgi:hypothetical protein
MQANVVCHFMVYNRIGEFAKNTRVVEMDGDSGFLPLSRDLPASFREGQYALFCSAKSRLDPQAIYYAPFSATNCKHYINSHWGIIEDDLKVYVHTVKDTDIGAVENGIYK